MERDVNGIIGKLKKVQLNLQSEESSLQEPNKTYVRDFLRWSRRQNNIISAQRLVKLHNTLVRLSGFFNHKDFKTITKEELTQFWDDLLDDSILSIKETAFSNETKRDFIAILKRFYLFLEGEGLALPKKIAHLKGFRSREKSPKVFKQEDVESIINSAKSNMSKALITILAITGARPAEALNLKREDIWEDKETVEDKEGSQIENGFIRIKIRTETSKTKGRVWRSDILGKQYESIIRTYLSEWDNKSKKYEQEISNKRELVKITNEKQDENSYKWSLNQRKTILMGYLFPVGSKRLSNIFRDATNEALGYSVSPYQLRRTAASELISLNITGDTVDYLMGWTLGSRARSRYLAINENVVDNATQTKRFEYEVTRTKKINDLQNQLGQQKIVVGNLNDKLNKICYVLYELAKSGELSKESAKKFKTVFNG
jgi:integrase